MSKATEYKNRVIQVIQNDIITLEDGFRYLWIDGKGAMTAHDLRIIAEELDRLNEEWNKQINSMCENLMSENLNGKKQKD